MKAFLHLMNLNMGATIDNAKRCCSLILSPLSVTINAAIAEVIGAEPGVCPWRLAQHYFGAQDMK